MTVSQAIERRLEGKTPNLLQVKMHYSAVILLATSFPMLAEKVRKTIQLA